MWCLKELFFSKGVNIALNTIGETFKLKPKLQIKCLCASRKLTCIIDPFQISFWYIWLPPCIKITYLQYLLIAFQWSGKERHTNFYFSLVKCYLKRKETYARFAKNVNVFLFQRLANKNVLPLLSSLPLIMPVSGDKIKINLVDHYIIVLAWWWWEDFFFLFSIPNAKLRGEFWQDL